MVTREDIENWVRDNGDSEGFYDTEAMVNHFVSMSKAELAEKACDWLKSNADGYTWYDESEGESGMTDEFVEDFKKSMAQEEKELLLGDLAARLSYEVK